MSRTEGSSLAVSPGNTGLSGLFPIAALRCRETLSRPLFAVIAIGFAALVLLLPRLVLFGFGDEARIVRETGTATLRLAALLFALAFGGAEDARERALVLARPVRPAAALLGRFFGTLAAMAMALTMLSVALGVALKSFASVSFDAASLREALLRTHGVYELAGIFAGALAEGAAILAVAAAAGEALPAGAAALVTFAAFTLGHVSQAARAVPLVPDLVSIAAGAPILALATVGAWLALAAALAESREPGREGSGAS